MAYSQNKSPLYQGITSGGGQGSLTVDPDKIFKSKKISTSGVSGSDKFASSTLGESQKKAKKPAEEDGKEGAYDNPYRLQLTGGRQGKATSDAIQQDILLMKGTPFTLRSQGSPLTDRYDRISAKHKTLHEAFEMGQTSPSEEEQMYRLEDKMQRIQKRRDRRAKK
tara:strand:+ start:93 stop:590 length:498 start_codon:yes stop_codon:yes gene_type:complete